MNYTQKRCPNTSRTISRFPSQERGGLRLIIGLSSNIGKIPAESLSVERLDEHNFNMGELLLLGTVLLMYRKKFIKMSKGVKSFSRQSFSLEVLKSMFKIPMFHVKRIKESRVCSHVK